MTMWREATVSGVALGLAFNPAAAAIGATAAAAVGSLVERKGGSRGWRWLIALAAWAIGDGVRIAPRFEITLAATRKLPFGAALAPWWGLALWAGIGFAVGYAIPSAVGALVGRRVTFGTGALAGGAVAFGLTLAFSTIGSTVADAVAKALG
jgi:hypothetical protein